MSHEETPFEKRIEALDKVAKPKLAPGFFAYSVIAVVVIALIVEQYQISQTRSTIQRTSCLQQNAQAGRDIASLVGTAQVLIDTAEAGRLRRREPPSDPVDIKNYLADVRRDAQINNPLRDCSKRGIEVWNNNPPAPVSCKPDGKGFCRIPP